MPRSRGGAAPARSAPSRPAAPAPARPSPQQQQQRPMSTTAAPPAQAAPQASQGSGLFGQMASTAAGVAVGSSIGHAIGGFFGGGSSAPAESAQQPVDNYSQPGQMYQTNSSAQAASGPCATDITNYTTCMTQNNGDMNICQFYLDQLKACQAAASRY